MVNKESCRIGQVFISAFLIAFAGCDLGLAEPLPPSDKLTSVPDNCFMPSHLWVSDSLGKPSNGVSRDQIAFSLSTLMDRIDIDYQDYTTTYENYTTGALDLRLTVDREGTITAADVLFSEVNTELAELVVNDLIGNQLSVTVKKPYVVKLSLCFNAE